MGLNVAEAGWETQVKDVEEGRQDLAMGMGVLPTDSRDPHVFLFRSRIALRY